MKTASTIIQYVVLGILGAVIYAGCHNNWLGRIPHYDLNIGAVIALGFAFAFTFVNSRRWVVKPFSCVSCLSGWFTMALGIYSFGWIGLVFLPIGYTVGALAGRLIKRFL